MFLQLRECDAPVPIETQELVALLRFLIAQQKQILHMNAHLAALEEFLLEAVGKDKAAEMEARSTELQSGDSFQGTRAVIALLEQMLAGLLPKTDQPQ